MTTVTKILRSKNIIKMGTAKEKKCFMKVHI